MCVGRGHVSASSWSSAAYAREFRSSPRNKPGFFALLELPELLTAELTVLAMFARGADRAPMDARLPLAPKVAEDPLLAALLVEVMERR